MDKDGKNEKLISWKDQIIKSVLEGYDILHIRIFSCCSVNLGEAGMLIKIF